MYKRTVKCVELAKGQIEIPVRAVKLKHSRISGMIIHRFCTVGIQHPEQASFGNNQQKIR